MKYLALALLLLSLTRCGTSSPAGSNGLKLYVYGDSISYGLTHPSYPEQIASFFGRKLVQNSHGGSSMFDKNSVGEEAQYPLIMGETWETGSWIAFAPGLNDAILHSITDGYVNRYTLALQDILLRMHSFHVRVFIGTPLRNCNERRFGPVSDASMYAEINRKLVTELHDPQITLIDYFNSFTPTLSNTLDCIHPNVNGYNELTKVFINSI